MKRTTIFVPESLERDLQLHADREGKPTAAIVREALTEYIARRRPHTTLPSFVGAFTSGHSDTAERHEELLFQDLLPHGRKAELVAKRPTTARRVSRARRRPKR